MCNGRNVRTHGELTDVAQVLDRRLDRIQRSLNRFPLVFGTAQILLLVLVILVLRKVGL
jgi:hypothetical protein